MRTQLRAIFDIIVEFQAKQSRMYTECLQEVELRQQYNATGVTHTERVINIYTIRFVISVGLIFCGLKSSDNL